MNKAFLFLISCTGQRAGISHFYSESNNFFPEIVWIKTDSISLFQIVNVDSSKKLLNAHFSRKNKDF